MSELSDNLQNAIREALDAINELNLIVIEKEEWITFLKQQLEAERAKVVIAVDALTYCSNSSSTHRILKSVEALEALAAIQARVQP
jgi:dTDP-D-glucose 4,6-dehydratase